MGKTLFEKVVRGEETPKSFERYVLQWKMDNEGKTLSEFIGIPEEELKGIQEGVHTFLFYVIRRIRRKQLLDTVFPGCYVQFAIEYPEMNAHLEYGWVDLFEEKTKAVHIQCDDNFYGRRVVEINIKDITQILPIKERPNVFYKAMLCKECTKCENESGEFVLDCPFYELFKTLKQNRIQSRDTIGKYLGYEKSSGKTEGIKIRSGGRASEPDDISSKS